MDINTIEYDCDRVIYLLPLITKMSDSIGISSCPILGLQTTGLSIDDSIIHLEEEIHHYLIAANTMGTLNVILIPAGFIEVPNLLDHWWWEYYIFVYDKFFIWNQ